MSQYVAGRNSEQCRDRYQEYLNPTITKGKWTEDQDSALLKAVEQVGEGKWREVSRVLTIGRTDNMVWVFPSSRLIYSNIYSYYSVVCGTQYS